MKRHLLLFQTTRAVIKAERACKKNGIHYTILPVPRSISSECGMAIESNPQDREAITALCETEGVAVAYAVWEKNEKKDVR
jgi:hypothetical protein